MNVGDSTLLEVNVEAQEVEIVNWFEFHWVSKEVVVDEGLNGWVVEEVFVVDNEPVVNISVVCKVQVGVLE